MGRPFKSLKDWADAFDKSHRPEPSEQTRQEQQSEQSEPAQEPVADIGAVDFSDVDWERGLRES